MRAEDHWEKSQHLENSRLRKLDPNADYELLIWSCIHGGAQLLNVILHRTGVTSDDYDMIHTSVPFTFPTPTGPFLRRWPGSSRWGLALCGAPNPGMLM
jgi:hypothetical protein